MVLSRFTTTQLAVGVLGGAFTVSVFGLYVNRESKIRLAQHPFYQDAIRVLRNHEGATTLLGTPIRDSDIDFSTDKVHNYVTADEAKIAVKVGGPMGKGEYHVEAKKLDSDRVEFVRGNLSIKLTTMLEKELYEGKKLVIYDRERHGPLEQFCPK